MAPQPLLGRYKLYKTGTARLIEWLGKTGGQCIDLREVLRTIPSKFSSKARAMNMFPKKIEITTRELVLLAQAILDSDPPADVPLAILDITRDVIKGRKESSSWYAAQGVSEDSKLSDENESHRHFITVLQDVLRLLTQAYRKQNPDTASSTIAQDPPSQQKKRKKNKGDRAQQAPEDKLGNLFAALHLEEPGPSPLGEDEAIAAQPRRSSTAITDFVLEDEDEDAAFATWCFLQDLDDVRSYVNATWKEYAKGELSFLAASTVTDTAFGLMHSADDAFTKENHFGKSTDWNDYTQFLGLYWWSRDRTIWLCPATQTTEPRLPDSEINIVRVLCPIAFVCLYGLRIDAAAVCKAAADDEPLPTRSCYGGPDSFHSFCSVLFKLAPELHSMGHAKNKCRHVEVDEFVQGLATMHVSGACPMWLVVACQIYLDLADLLDEHIDHGSLALQLAFRETEGINTRLAEHMVRFDDPFADVANALDKVWSTAQASHCFEHSSLLPPQSDAEPASSESTKVKRVLGTVVTTTERKLTAHAGAILANVKFGLLDAGVAIANHDGIVLSMAHLYKALRAMGTLDMDWPDMDFLLAMFKTKQPLVARLGSKYDGQAAHLHFLMALGVPASDFARDCRRRHKTSPAIRDLRKIAITSPLLQKMSDRQAAWEDHGIGYSKTKTVEIVLDALTRTELDTDRTTHKRRSFTPVQLLSTYKKTIIAEEPTINFDFTSFTVSCANLLNNMVPLTSTDTEVPKFHHFTMVTELLQCKDKASVEAVASALTDYILESGRVFIKSAHEKSSGRIPKHLRPPIVTEPVRGEKLHAMMCTMLDYPNTKFMFSGPAMAAYHPSVKPEFPPSLLPTNS